VELFIAKLLCQILTLWRDYKENIVVPVVQSTTAVDLITSERCAFDCASEA